MHEASVTEAIVKMALEEAAAHNATKVRSISLVVGETTGYMAESLEFYFRNFSRGTVLEGAELRTTYVKPKIRCPACGLVFDRRQFSFDCPTCGAQGVMTSVGNEFYIDTMDIEKEEE
jgi:Zn finger protein HypA/HybF (possibly regulating hydrogenase expression)